MKRVGLGAAGLAVLAVVALLAEPSRFWTAYAATALFGLSVAAGSIAFAAALEITGAGWADRLRPQAEAWLRPLVVSVGLLLALALGAPSIYPWAQGAAPGFEWWLAPGRVLFRDLVLAGALVLTAVAFVRAPRPARRARAVGYALVYAVVGTMLSWDLVMSLEPGWINTLLGAWFFAGGLYAGIAAAAVAGARLRPALDVEASHDLGKLLFGSTMVWGYFVWSQYLVFWYGNLPHESGFWLRRTEAGWGALGLLVAAGAFLAPFVLLLPRALKRNPRRLGAIGALILVALWAEKVLLFGPVARATPTLPIGATDLVIAAALLTVLLASRPAPE